MFANRASSLRTAARPRHGGEALGFIKEFWLFLKVRKKFWLLPILLVAALFGGLLVVTEGSAAAPFIYTLF